MKSNKQCYRALHILLIALTLLFTACRKIPVSITWKTIPAGNFSMGCSPNDGYCDDHEKPQHTVSVSSFQMTATEITQSQYQVIMGSNPSSWSGRPNNSPASITFHPSDN